MFGSERRQAERKEKRRADIKEFVKYTGMKKKTAKYYFEVSPNKSLQERKDWWDTNGKEVYTKVTTRQEGLVEFFRMKEEFQGKLDTIPALLEKPNLKNLAEAVSIQHEYIAHMNENFGRSQAGLVVDGNFSVDKD